MATDDKKAKAGSVAALKEIWGTKKIEDGTLMITSYKGTDKDVIIPDVFGKNTVSTISPTAFSPYADRISPELAQARKNIESITIPGSIKVLDSVFGMGNESLKKVILLEGIETIGDSAFSGCPLLEEIIIPDTVTRIGNSAFSDCPHLKEIIIPDAVTAIGVGAFEGCKSLKSIKLPLGITELADSLFSRTGFESFEISKEIKSLGSGVFGGCDMLTSVKMPEGFDSIPHRFFEGCTALTEFSIPKSVKTIGFFSFSHSGIKEIAIPDGVESILESAFYGCKNLCKVSLAEHVKLENDVFAACHNLANNGQIIVNGMLFGIAVDDSPNLYLENAIIPLKLDRSIKHIATSIHEIPDIAYFDSPRIETSIDVSQLKVGDEIEFGEFPYDTSFELKPIKWRVLDIKDGKALIITSDSIMSQSLYVEQRGTWADSGIRKLLNEGFIDVAFTENEKSHLVLSTISNEGNKQYKIPKAEDTEDKVFLLSLEEVHKYMPDDKDMRCGETDYAKARTSHRNIMFWHTRTPGQINYGAVAVSSFGGEGAIHTNGGHVGRDGTRPALWIK